MSMRAVVIWVVVLAVLGGVTFFATRPAPKPAAPTSMALMSIPAARISQVVVGDSGGKWSRQFTRQADGSWIAGTEAGERWFADGERVEAFLKVLAQARATLVDAAFDGGVSKADLVGDDKSVRRVEFDDRDLGGTVMARTTDATGVNTVRVAGNLPGLLTEASVRTWVSRAVFPLGVADAEEIRVTQAELGVTLKRVGQKWVIVEPRALPADQEEVGKLVKSLGMLGFAELSAQSDAEKGKRVRVEVSSEVRGLNGDAVVRTKRKQTLVVSATEGTGRVGALASVSVGEEGVPPRTIGGLVEAAGVEGLSPDAVSYTKKTVMTLARADVRLIGVTAGGKQRVYELGVDGWKGKAGAPALRAAELLDWLESEKAERVLLTADTAAMIKSSAASGLGMITIGPDSVAGQVLAVSALAGDAFPGLVVQPGANVIVVRDVGRTLVFTSMAAARVVAAVFGEGEGPRP